MRTRLPSALAVVVGLALGAVLGTASTSEASRNNSGTYSLPSGNPVVSGTTITTTWANTTLSDIASELTNSLDRPTRLRGVLKLKPPQPAAGASSARRPRSSRRARHQTEPLP